MTITNNIAAKLAVAFVAVAMAFSLVAPAQAQNVSSMSLEQLIALVNQLQSQLAGSSSGSTGTCSYVFTRSLGQGSTGADVMNLQKFLNTTGDTQVAPAGVAGGPNSETSFYGPATAAAVSKFQTKYSADILVPSGLTSPTGYFGPASMAKANALCTSTGGGTTPGGSTTGPLQGGAGDLSIRQITSGTQTTVGEGREENVLGMEAEADTNSDIAITSIRVAVGITGSGVSTRLNRYVDEVVIYLGNREIGSARASDFSRSGATSTATISLRDAVVRSDTKERLYVAFVANEVIDTTDQGATVLAQVDRVRFEDATGAILTEGTIISDTVTFEDSSVDDGARVQNVSNTPDARILKVEESSTSDGYHVFTFRVRGDSKSSALSIITLPIVVEFNNASSSAVMADNIIDDMWMEVGNETFDDYTRGGANSLAAGTSSRTYTFNIDEGDFEIAGGDTEDVKVYVKFGRQAGRYTVGSTVKLSVVGADVIAETQAGNTQALSSNATGKVQTLSLAAAEFSGWRWESGLTTLEFFFTVHNDGDEAFDVEQASLVFATSGSATTTVGNITRSSGDASGTPGDYEVEPGDTATFRVTFTASGANGSTLRASVTSVAGQSVPNNNQESPLLTLNLQGN